MQEQFQKPEQRRAAKSPVRVRKTFSAVLGAAGTKRLILAALCFITALLAAGTAAFPGTYPFGIALVASAGGLLQAASAAAGSLAGAVRIPGSGGFYALLFVALFAVRVAVSLFLAVPPRGLSPSDPGVPGEPTDSIKSLSGSVRFAFTTLFRSLARLLTEEDGADDFGGFSDPISGRSRNPGSGGAARTKMNAGTVLREPVRIRMALSACAALFAGAWSVVAGGYEYADLFGAVFSTLTTPLATYLFYAASDRNMRASPFREFGVYALLMVFSLSLHAVSGSLFSIRLPVRSITGGAAMLRRKTLFDAGAFFSLAASLVIARNHGWQRGALAGVLCGMTMDPVYVPMYALSAVAWTLLERLPAAFGVLGAGTAAVSWAIFAGGIDGFTFAIPPVSVLCAVLIPLFRYDLAKTPDDLFGSVPLLSLSSAGKAGKARGMPDPGERLLARELSERVSGMTEGLSSVSAVLYAISDRLSKPTKAETKAAVEESFSESCSRCVRRSACRMSDPARAEKLIRSMTDALGKDGFVSAALIPPALASACPDIGDILDRVNRVLADRAAAFSRESRLLCSASDWELAGELFRSAEERGKEASAPDRELEKKLRKLLPLNGFNAESVRVYGGRFKSIRADGVDLYSTRLGGDELRRLFEGIVRRPLSQPEFEISGPTLSMKIRTVSAFSVRQGCFSCAASGVRRYCGEERSRGADSGEEQLSGIGKRRRAGKDRTGEGIEAEFEKVSVGDEEIPEDEVCGDVVTSFEADGRFYMILSDGMGSGREAALSAGMAASLLERMLRAGAGMETSLRMLNQILRSAGRECPATVDAAEIDLTSGEARFVKSGAAPSFVLRDGSIFRLQSKTVPIGILRALDAEMIRFDVRQGDTVVMVSDGAAKSFDEEPWLLDLLTSDEEILSGDEKRAAMTVVSEAALRGSKDDISCGVFRIFGRAG